MRQIVLDTETTGIGHEFGHRIIEIGCVELIDRKLTGTHFHVYLNPQRDVDEGAFRVHGISTQFLQDKPLFEDIESDFMQFITDSDVIIHNAPFDVGFINAELKRANVNKTLKDYCKVIDTLVIARNKHPGQRNSLDALCKRYDVDNSNRELHGALLDAEILARVYLAMTGGQTNLFADENTSMQQNKKMLITKALKSESPVLLANPLEIDQHNEFIDFLVKKSGVNHWSESEKV